MKTDKLNRLWRVAEIARAEESVESLFGDSHYFDLGGVTQVWLYNAESIQTQPVDDTEKKSILRDMLNVPNRNVPSAKYESLGLTPSEAFEVPYLAVIVYYNGQIVKPLENDRGFLHGVEVWKTLGAQTFIQCLHDVLEHRTIGEVTAYCGNDESPFTYVVIRLPRGKASDIVVNGDTYTIVEKVKEHKAKAYKRNRQVK